MVDHDLISFSLLASLSHTYTCIGHGKAVRDVSFNRDGSKFLSCGYDRYIKLWDTETGQLSPYK